MGAPTVTCYGAVNEIGGSKILLEDGDARIFFDFGIAFGRRGMFFNEFLNPRPARGLLDPLSLDLIPPLEGIYRDDLTRPELWRQFRSHPFYRDLRRDGRLPVDAVFVSHAHLDHHGDISFLRPDIPIVASRTSAVIARAMQVTGVSAFEREFCYINSREYDPEHGDLKSVPRSPYLGRSFSFLEGELPEGVLAWWRRSPAKTKALEEAPIIPFSGGLGRRTGAAGGRCGQAGAGDRESGNTGGGPRSLRGSGGNLRVRWWPVDHSLFGAVGLAVETSAGWVGYSGDIRFHGRHGDLTRRFADELGALRLVALLCEGTNVGEERQIVEREVKENSLQVVKGAAGKLVVADFGPRNVERLLIFLEIARETGRRLVILPKDVYLLEAMAWVHADVPHLETLPEVFLYADPKTAPNPWEKDTRADYVLRTVGPADVAADPGGCILCFSLWDLNDLLDVGPLGGVYLYSSSRAYDDEQRVDMDRLRNWIGHFGMTMRGDPDLERCFHASGHACGPALLDFVRRARPKHLIPIHTEQPDYFQRNLAGTGIDILLPEYGKAIELG